MSLEVPQNETKEDFEAKLNELFEVRNALVKCEDKEGVVKEGLAKAQEKLKSQTASVFLFGKDGYLHRFQLCGVDKDGLPIEEGWFSEESHEPGKSFSGRAVLAEPGSAFGRCQWSFDLRNDNQIANQSRTNYSQKLGGLYCAIAVPLNGQHRTYGVLEVINKIDEEGKPSPKAFSNDDIHWLSIIGMNIATAISGLRSKEEFKMLAEMSNLLIIPFSIDSASDFNPQPVYENMVKKIVCSETCYSVCVLRIADADKTLRVIAKATDNISWNDDQGKPITIRDSIKKGEGLAGRVYKTEEPIIIRRIEDGKNEFRNIDWIKSNHLKSYACFPLSIESKVVGTLSLYTGFIHNFDDSDTEFLENICSLIATFSESLRVINELETTHDQLEQERQKITSWARDVGTEPLMEGVLHRYQNELKELKSSLKESLTSSPGKKDEIIKAQVNRIEKQIEQIQKEFGDKSVESKLVKININDLVRDVVRYFKLELRGKHISLDANDLDDQIPEIMAEEAEMREVIRNLVDNAVKAIRKGKSAKDGRIRIYTGIGRFDGIDQIEICVEDNGVGIRNEDKDRIYERGFSSDSSGTGMGLYITKRVLENYGGSVNFQSSVGRGAIFTGRIPLKRNLPRER